MIPLFSVPPIDSRYLTRAVGGYPRHSQSKFKFNDGSFVQQFENRLALDGKCTLPVAVNSCTSALHLALILSGVQSGDEVILPPQTFVATGMAVLYCGATPVFADVNESGLIDIRSVISKITSRTKAVIVVDWLGNPVDVRELSTYLASTKGQPISIIRDAAQSFGAEINDTPIGFCANGERFVCFSFQTLKHVTCGDGGALCCLKEDDRDLARRMSWFGMQRNFDRDELGRRPESIRTLGYKYGMNDVAAAIGIGSLESFPKRFRRRQMIAGYFASLFLELPTIHIDFAPVGTIHSRYAFGIRIRENRDEFVRYCRSNDIEASIIDERIDAHGLFMKYRNGKNFYGELRRQDYYDREYCVLPCHEGLSDDDVEKIATTVQRFFKEVSNKR